MSKYVISWIDGAGKSHSYDLEDEMFIGRLPLALLEKLGYGYDYVIHVFAYRPRTHTALAMGIDDATVSRFHTKLFIENGRVYIVDHGKEGKGSKNGTYVNSKKIPPGKPIELDLSREAACISIGLYTTYRVGLEYRGKLRMEIPADSIALLTDSEVQEIRRTSPEAIDVVVPAFNGGKYLIVILKKLRSVETSTSIIRSIETSARERAEKSLLVLSNVLAKARIALIEGKYDDARNMLLSLGNKDIREKVAESANVLGCTSIISDLERLLLYLRDESTPREVVMHAIDRIRNQIEIALQL